MNDGHDLAERLSRSHEEIFEVCIVSIETSSRLPARELCLAAYLLCHSPRSGVEERRDRFLSAALQFFNQESVKESVTSSGGIFPELNDWWDCVGKTEVEIISLTTLIFTAIGGSSTSAGEQFVCACGRTPVSATAVTRWAERFPDYPKVPRPWDATDDEDTASILAALVGEHLGHLIEGVLWQSDQ